MRMKALRRVRDVHGGAPAFWKGALFAAGLVLLSGLTAGCDDDEVIVRECRGVEPAAPRGAYTVTGDEVVSIYWLPNTEPDIAGYGIYRSLDEDGPYDHLADVGPEVDPDFFDISYHDRRVENGVTYYYGVTAFDDEDLESDLNPTLLFDTPRPEGSVVLRNAAMLPNSSGYDFSERDRLSWENPRADIFYEATQAGGLRIYTVNEGHDVRTDIQDLGYVGDPDLIAGDPGVIGWAPEDGWSANGWVEAIRGHTYVVWTRDNHFAKIFVRDLSEEALDLYWAYQIDPGNPELMVPLEVSRSDK
ncbi:MAG: hypothetical protein GF355_01355 [Candidatus Eisenbacteria bacterium]|nr:hypothetical protein [Candidatus Eisenbacteria bacterium]